MTEPTVTQTATGPATSSSPDAAAVAAASPNADHGASPTAPAASEHAASTPAPASEAAQAAPAAASAAASSAAAPGAAAPGAAANDATSAAPPKKSSPDALTEFFRTSNAARIAAGSLKKAAEVGVHFTDAPGDYRFTTESGAPLLLQGTPKDPDFELTFAPGAVRALAERPDADVGDLGILFFQHMLTHDPDAKIKVKLHSGLLKLTMRGYLGVLASGGSKVFGWLATKGLKGPGAVGAALNKLKKS